jgi:glycosyltransferase involved in cell wall biosynthesis
VSSSGPGGERDIAAITYGANPEKKGLDRVLAAWLAAGRAGEELVVAGLDERRGAEWLRRAAGAGAGGAATRVRFTGMLSRAEYRALLRRSRVFLTAPRREDYGIAQLEALADGCMLVTTPAPGPYAALPVARELDPRLVSAELAIRTALDDPAPGYAQRAALALAPWSPESVDRVVAEQLLPRLLA